MKCTSIYNILIHALIITGVAASIANTSKTLERNFIKKDVYAEPYNHHIHKALVETNISKFSVYVYRDINKRHKWYTNINTTQTNIYLIILCGDIHSNPGPTKYPCTLCAKAVKSNQKALQCDECNEWTHIKCNGQINEKEYAMFQKHEHLSWSCHNCLFTNVSTSFFNLSVGNDNSFSSLSDSNSDELDTNKSINITLNENNNQNLTMIGINTTSLYSLKQRIAFQSLVDTHRPDILCVNETNVDKSFQNPSILPTDHYEIIKDRKKGDRGVLIASKTTLICTEQTKLRTECEIIWTRIQIEGSKNLYIGSFYRNPKSTLQDLENLDRSLSMIDTNSNNIILMGDFNLPSINWENGTIKPVAQYEPTRENNILDLCFTNNPNLIKKVEVGPGISDHNLVKITINTKAKIHKKPPRKIYMYKKGNMEGIRSDLRSKLENFKEDSNKEGIETSWTNFKHLVTESIENNIPSKNTTTRWNLPWITTETKQMIRRKQRLYNKAKKSNDKKHWKDFKLYRKKVKEQLQSNHDQYVKDILTPEEPTKAHTDSCREQIYATTKKFWSYIKGMKKDSSNISMLNKNGKDIIDAEEKANILNQQYESAFSDIDFNQYIDIRFYTDVEFRLPKLPRPIDYKKVRHHCQHLYNYLPEINEQ
ncbi:unnamed protein product [Mytilus edulis]|uniref:PHD-type domain-containing protein n=1 Tax=Mytilus edulis TaxID=6550 RepID=A0A8S3QV65_MYTED|nr:unnamed protein product [Mytilus edulis]